MIQAFPIEGKGRGVLATRNIEAGALIAIDHLTLFKTNLLESDQCFCFDNERDCIPLGLIQLCNHSYTPSAYWVLDDRDYSMRIYATRAIAVGEEITIPYNYALNFDVVDTSPKEQTP